MSGHHGVVTDPSPVDPPPPDLPPEGLPPEGLPPDPAAYDSPRAVRAREKGLPTPYIPGGGDPDPDAGRAQDRRYGTWLVVMVAVIVASGFVVGILTALIGRG